MVIVKRALARWMVPSNRDMNDLRDEHDALMLKLSRKYSKMYLTNVFTLNKVSKEIDRFTLKPVMFFV